MTGDKGRGGRWVPAPLICYNPGERVEGDYTENRAFYYMNNGFGSELFKGTLVSLKLQPISYEDPLLQKLLNELFS
jgi:hypothetical protein